MRRDLKTTEKCGKHLFEGFCIDLAERIAQEVGFTYDICLVPDEAYGEQLPNGTWNGMIGELVKGVCVVSILLNLLSERVQFCLFSLCVTLHYGWSAL